MQDGGDHPGLGLGAGKVYPASRASLLLNPLRGLLQSPRRLVRRLGLRPDARVLELGCGPGWFSPELARAVPDGQLVMVDLQPEMLSRARRRVGSGATMTCGDATALPVRSGTVDAVFLSAVLGEVPDRDAALAEVARVLAPGGRAVLAETRTDPDFIALPELCDAMATHGLQLLAEHRGRTQYVASFAAEAPGPSGATGDRRRA